MRRKNRCREFYTQQVQGRKRCTQNLTEGCCHLLVQTGTMKGVLNMGMTQTLRQGESYGIFSAFGSSDDCFLRGIDPAKQGAIGALLLMII